MRFTAKSLSSFYYPSIIHSIALFRKAVLIVYSILLPELLVYNEMHLTITAEAQDGLPASTVTALPQVEIRSQPAAVDAFLQQQSK